MSIENIDTKRYKIIRHYKNEEIDSEIIRTGLTLKEAQDHCHDPETSSSTAKSAIALAGTKKYGEWFDAYSEE